MRTPQPDNDSHPVPGSFSRLNPEIPRLLEQALGLENAEQWLARFQDSVSIKKEDFLRLLNLASEACEEWTAHSKRLERALHLTSQELLERNLSLQEALKSLTQKTEELQTALTERDQAFKLLEYARNRFSQLFHKMPIASLTIDTEGLVWEWNERAVPLFLIPEHTALAQPLPDVLGRDCVCEDTLNKLKAVAQGMPFEEREWKRQNQHLLVNAMPLCGPDEALTGVLITLVDITELRLKEKELAEKIAELNEARETLERANQRLAELATVDPLTRIPNRRALDDQLIVALSEAKRGKAFSLALIDLDHFKSINDELGHDAGDEVLQQFAVILRETVRKADFVARYGGEEFAVIFPNTPLSLAIPICERICQKAKDISIRNRTLSVSIGVAQSDCHTPEAKDILKQADDALYQAKRTGRDRVVAYSAQPEAGAA